MPLPVRNRARGRQPSRTSRGGGYFYLDQHDRAVSRPTTTTSSSSRSTARSRLPGRCRLRPQRAWCGRTRGSSRCCPTGTGGCGSSPGRAWSGRSIARTARCARMRLGGEGISQLLRRGRDRGRLHGLRQGPVPLRRRLQGRAADQLAASSIRTSGIHKPGQSDAGSGTTPTLMGNGWVAITDNADPMNVVVYRRARGCEGAMAAGRRRRRGWSALRRSSPRAPARPTTH